MTNPADFNPVVDVPRDDLEPRGMTLPPAIVEAIRDDPAAVQPVARVMAITLLYEQYKESTSYTPAQKLALTETLARLGNLDKKHLENVTSAPVFSVQINIPGSEKSVVVNDITCLPDDE